MTEAQHQRLVMEWSLRVRGRYPELKLLHHVPNGGRRDPVEARHLKEQGVKPGVPDLDLPVARGQYHGLRIELKAERGRESEAQAWWREELNRQGYHAVVCQGWQEAVGVLEWYLGLDGAKGQYKRAEEW